MYVGEFSGTSKNSSSSVQFYLVVPFTNTTLPIKCAGFYQTEEELFSCNSSKVKFSGWDMEKHLG